MMPLDHGILNLPLSKRGNFHKELDDHLKEEKQRKAREIFDAKAEFEEAKRVAKSLFEVNQWWSSVTPEKVMRLVNYIEKGDYTASPKGKPEAVSGCGI
ncbi:hypothetical protein ACB374_15195 [Serratia marcescens]